MHASGEERSDTERRRGFGRDVDLAADRGDPQAGGADLDATEAKADERPVIHYSPDPDREGERTRERAAFRRYAPPTD